MTTDGSEHGNSYLRAEDPREARLQEIRRKAALSGMASPAGDGDLMPHASPETGYYGRPLLKRPQWSREIPLYFFCGGAAGAAAIIGTAAKLAGGDPGLVRDARYLAVLGAAVSPPLLISDLGMPSRFLNMFRVFKFQSPMSMGSWTLMVFSSSAAAAAFLGSWRRQCRGLFKVVEAAGEIISTITGPIVSTYTGVLLGATAIPAWNQSVGLLPLHFATSGMATAAAILELRGHESPALNTVGIMTALGETAIGASIELQRSRALKPIKSGRAGWWARAGGALSGPIPLILRLLARGTDEKRNARLRKIAAASAVAGSLATRIAWTQAGAPSSRDTRLLLGTAAGNQTTGD